MKGYIYVLIILVFTSNKMFSQEKSTENVPKKTSVQTTTPYKVNQVPLTQNEVAIPIASVEYLDEQKIKDRFKELGVVKNSADQYFGLEKGLVELLKVETIPSDFPKNDGFENLYYKKIVTAWFKQNMNLVQEKYIIRK